jgi:hypothetical protein
MSSWRHFEEFARRFHLADSVSRPETRACFGPSLEFAAALIDMVAELDARRDMIAGFDAANARDGWMRSAQHLIESIVAATAGLYAGANVIYRLSVEATLRSTFTEAEILAKLPAGRREEIRENDWDIGAADYRRVLARTKGCHGAVNRLYTVYRTLSKVAHGSLHLFAGLDQHLHALPRFDASEAEDLGLLLREGCAASGILLRTRFRPLFLAANLERVAAFDRTVRELDAPVEPPPDPVP